MPDVDYKRDPIHESMIQNGQERSPGRNSRPDLERLFAGSESDRVQDKLFADVGSKRSLTASEFVHQELDKME